MEQPNNISNHADHVERLFEKFGYNPITELIDIARDSENEVGDRIRANTVLAKYRFPSLKAVETSKALDTKIVVNIANIGNIGAKRAEFTQTITDMGEDSAPIISASATTLTSTDDSSIGESTPDILCETVLTPQQIARKQLEEIKRRKQEG